MRNILQSALLATASMMGLGGNGFRKQPAPKKQNSVAADAMSAKRVRRFYQSEQQKIIGRMTNWQRNQWGRNGHSMKIKDLEHYASLKHWKQA